MFSVFDPELKLMCLLAISICVQCNSVTEKNSMLKYMTAADATSAHNSFLLLPVN